MKIVMTSNQIYGRKSSYRRWNWLLCTIKNYCNIFLSLFLCSLSSWIFLHQSVCQENRLRKLLDVKEMPKVPIGEIRTHPRMDLNLLEQIKLNLKSPSANWILHTLHWTATIKRFLQSKNPAHAFFINIMIDLSPNTILKG